MKSLLQDLMILKAKIKRINSRRISKEIADKLTLNSNVLSVNKRLRAELNYLTTLKKLDMQRRKNDFMHILLIHLAIDTLDSLEFLSSDAVSKKQTFEMIFSI